MLIYFQSISSVLLCIYVTKVISSSFYNDKTAEEYIMTSANIDGIKRSNVCGEGYRIEGAVLKSYPYSKNETYLPYENCFMTFQARRSNNQIRIHILTLDLNDINGGMNCLDSLRFYTSVYTNPKDKISFVECGQLTETDNFSIISPTGIVTAHFSTDGGNVNGLGFKVILTAFRYPNKTHQCNFDDEEFLCTNGECISSLLLCDGVRHCMDGSDEIPNPSCMSNGKEYLTTESTHRIRTIKHQHWRGILIVAFLLIIFIVFASFMVCFFCRRCINPRIRLIKTDKKNYSTIVNSPLNGPKNVVTTQVIKHRKHLDDDYNLI